MKVKEISDAYDSCAEKYACAFFNELDYKPLDRQLLNRFAKMVRKNGKVCDIGCGPGEIAHYLYNKKLNVTGIDISEEMIFQAKKLSPQISFETGDMFHLKYEDNYLSGITSFYAIVNFNYEEIRLIIKEYYRVLEKKGILFLSFHTGDEMITADNFFECGKSLDFYFLDENRIIEILTGTGFIIHEALVRFPYKEEHQSKRACILAEK